MKKRDVVLILIAIAHLAYIFINVSSFSSSELLLNIYLFIYDVITLIYIKIEFSHIISIKTIFVVLYGVMIGLSPAIYYFNTKSFITLTGNNIDYQYSICIIGYLLLLLGMYVLPKKEAYKKEMTRDQLIYSYNFGIVLLAISTLVNFYYIIINANYLFGNDLESSRVLAQYGNGLVMVISSLNVPAIGMIFNYCYETNRHKYLLILSIIVTFIIYIIRGSRTPILKIIILLFLIYNSKKKIKVKNAIKIFGICVLILAILQVERSYFSGVETTLMKQLLVMFNGGSINIDYIFHTFPKRVNFQYGYGFLINFIMLRPGHDPDFTLWLKDLIGLNYSGGGLTPTLFGEGYLNFGYIGGFIEIFLAGMVAKILDSGYRNAKGNIVWISYIIVVVIDMFRGGFSNIEIVLIVILALYIGFNLLKPKLTYDDVKKESIK